MTDKKNIPKVELYSDGWANPNPWRAGYWIILKYKWITKEFSAWYKMSTNNRMELSWVIIGLEKLKEKCDVQIFTDSQYTINGIKKWWAKKWKANNWFRTKTEKAINYDLWEKLLILTEKHNVVFNWVKGHSGHIENERCDELATLAMDMEILIEDEFYIKNYFDENILKEKNWKKNSKENIFNPPKKQTKISKIWDICNKCSSPVIKKIPKKKKLKEWQKYYFEYFLYCPVCKTNYMIEEWKREI